MVNVSISCDANPVDEQVTGYNFFQDGQLVGSVPSPSFSIQNVPVGPHAYSVSALNSLGEGPQSDPISIFVPSGAPSKCVNVVVNVSVQIA